VTSALLTGGALHRTLGRIAREAEHRQRSSQIEKRRAA
jgi:hypothetical protein